MPAKLYPASGAVNSPCYKPRESEDDMNPPRRGFLKALVVAPLAAPSAAAMPPQAAPAAAAKPSPSPASTPTAADALTEASRLLLGAHFPSADVAEVRKSIDGNLKAAAAVKAARVLTNADEPVLSFAALPEPMRKARGGKR
jgi:hypothetical protein